jgi:hypothetical protein
MLDRAVADGLVVHPGRSARTLKMHFTEPATFRFFWFLNGRTVRAWSWMVLTSPSESPQYKRCFLVFLSEALPSVADGPPQGLGRFTHR